MLILIVILFKTKYTFCYPISAIPKHINIYVLADHTISINPEDINIRLITYPKVFKRTITTAKYPLSQLNHINDRANNCYFLHVYDKIKTLVSFLASVYYYTDLKPLTELQFWNRWLVQCLKLYLRTLHPRTSHDLS